MNKKKILIIGQTPPPYGGQIIHIGKIVSILKNNDFNFHIIRTNFFEELSNAGKPSIKKIIKLFILILRILKELLLYRPAYVYYPPSGCEKIPVIKDIIVLFFVRFLRYKTVFHFHAGGISGIFEKFNPILRYFFKYSLFKPDYSICMSNTGLKDPVFLKSKQNVIIPYAVESICNDINIIEKRIKDKDFFVLFVGVCKESKGIIDFIECIRIANSKNKNIKGLILGSIFSEKENLAITGGVKDGLIDYQGIKIGQEKCFFFKKAHLFLFPSFFEHENFPTVILEAFSAALPVVSTKWRGIVNQINHEENGFVYDIHDIESMADSIVNLSFDHDKYRKISLNSYTTYKKWYQEHTFENNIINFFNSLK